MSLQLQSLEARVLSTSDDEIARLANQVLRHVEPKWSHVERRGHRRCAYPTILGITPLIDGTLEPARETRFVVGRNLARNGIDFFHDKPFKEKQVVVSMECKPDSWVHLVLDVNWCRFVRAGWYISGGKFVKVVDWPGCDSSDYQA